MTLRSIRNESSTGFHMNFLLDENKVTNALKGQALYLEKILWLGGLSENVKFKT